MASSEVLFVFNSLPPPRYLRFSIQTLMRVWDQIRNNHLNQYGFQATNHKMVLSSASFSNSLSFLQLDTKRIVPYIFIVSHRKLYNVQAIRTNANAITGDALFLPSTKETGGKEEIRKGFFRSDAGTGGPIFGPNLADQLTHGHLHTGLNTWDPNYTTVGGFFGP